MWGMSYVYVQKRSQPSANVPSTVPAPDWALRKYQMKQNEEYMEVITF